jgi:hypothetical protein
MCMYVDVAGVYVNANESVLARRRNLGIKCSAEASHLQRQIASGHEHQRPQLRDDARREALHEGQHVSERLTAACRGAHAYVTWAYDRGHFELKLEKINLKKSTFQ